MRKAVPVYRAVLDVNDRATAVYAADRKKAEPFNLRIRKRRGEPPDASPPGKEAVSA